MTPTFSFYFMPNPALFYCRVWAKDFEIRSVLTLSAGNIRIRLSDNNIRPR